MYGHANLISGIKTNLFQAVTDPYKQETEKRIIISRTHPCRHDF